MFGIGFSEIVIIVLVGFIAVGPKQLPALMKTLAGYYRQFLNLKEEFRFQILSVDEQEKENVLEVKNSDDAVMREKDRG